MLKTWLFEYRWRRVLKKYQACNYEVRTHKIVRDLSRLLQPRLSMLNYDIREGQTSILSTRFPHAKKYIDKVSDMITTVEEREYVPVENQTDAPRKILLDEWLVDGEHREVSFVRMITLLCHEIPKLVDGISECSLARKDLEEYYYRMTFAHVETALDLITFAKEHIDIKK